jgi:hypothetical protein
MSLTPKEFALQWLSALRCGKYQQGRVTRFFNRWCKYDYFANNSKFFSVKR